MATSNIQAQQPIRGFGSSKCPHHHGKEVICLCENCQELVCINCVTGNHRGHVFEDMIEIMPEVNRNIQDSVSKLEQTDIPYVTEKLQTVNDDVLNEKQYYKTQIQELEGKLSFLKKEIKNVTKTLQQFKGSEQQNIDILLKHEKEIKAQLGELRSKLEELKETLQSGSDVQKYDVAKNLPLCFKDIPIPTCKRPDYVPSKKSPTNLKQKDPDKLAAVKENLMGNDFERNTSPSKPGKVWKFMDGNNVALYKQKDDALKDCEVLLEPVPKPSIASYNNFSFDTSADYMKVEMQVCTLDSGNQDCVEQLEKTFIECLDFIFAEQKKSVAIPINVQRKINWDDAEFLSQIITIIRKFKTSSNEYRFYVSEPSECQKFIPLMEQQLLDLGAETESSDEGVQDQGASGPAVPERKQEIMLIKGELAKQKCDVIVNTTSKELNLSNGAVSHSLLLAAGSRLQEECSRKYRNGIDHGEVAVTKGYRLRCKDVYHGALPGYSNTGVQIMRKFMAECLRLAAQDKMTSIAFPALGTGNLGFPSDVVASTMYEVVRAFGRKYPNATLTQIYFVIYQRDEPTYKAFEAVQLQYKTVTPTAPSVDQPSPSASLHMKYGPTNLWISQEEVKNITADVLVLFWYLQEIFQIPVRKHGLLKAGQKVHFEWNQNRTKFAQHSKEVKIRMTLAGELPYKRIIHIRCENQSAEDILFQMLSELCLMDYETAAIVYHQKTDRICSTVPAEKFAKEMDSALKSFNKKCKENKIKRLEILTDTTGLHDKLSSAFRQTSSDSIVWDIQQQHAGATAKTSDQTAAISSDAELALIGAGDHDDVDKDEVEKKL